MRQQQFESAVARATGESVRTIQLRGFSLVRMSPDDGSVFLGHRASSRSRPLSDSRPPAEEDPDFEKKHIEICNQNIEKWIHQYPEQFLWVHKRFKDTLDYSKARLPWEL